MFDRYSRVVASFANSEIIAERPPFSGDAVTREKGLYTYNERRLFSIRNAFTRMKIDITWIKIKTVINIILEIENYITTRVS